MDRSKRRIGKRLGVFGMVIFAVVGLVAYQSFYLQVRATRLQISDAERVDFRPMSRNGEVAYLTDGDFLASSKTAYGTILKDTTASGTNITLRSEGKNQVFERGIWAHATSNVDFDLRQYHGKYDYLMVYVGLNKTANSAGSVKFSVFTSDAEMAPTVVTGWTVLPEMNGELMTVNMDAKLLKIDIRDVNYIRFYADANGSNSNDHAVYGDLMLVTEEYGAHDYLVPTLDEFDGKLKDGFGGSSLDDLARNADYQATVLRRTLVEQAGRTTVVSFLRQSEANCEMFNWLYNELEVLDLYINGGKLSTLGNYNQSLAALVDLYSAYKGDLADTTPLSTTAGTRGELYLRMMMTISLTHAEHIRLWVRDRVLAADGTAVSGEAVDSANVSRPVDRYAVYKRMYLAGKLNTTIFEQLEVEEMRYVMASLIGDDELEWLHDYLEYKGKSPYSFPAMPYASAGYWHVEDYADENQDSLTATWRLDGRALGVGDYKITNEKYQPHVWMILKWGGVCWQISNTGQNMMSSYGIPSTTLGQRPDHVAYANYGLQANGDGYWALTNNVYGWTTTDFVGYDGLYSYRYSNAPMRHMNDWGFYYDSRAYAYKYNGTYLLLAQAAINDYDNYIKARELVLLAEAYEGDLDKQEEIYNKALEIQDINLDAWLGLIQVYKAKYAQNENGAGASGADMAYLDLATRITGAYRMYPVPMYDMLRLFSGQISEPAVQAAVLMAQTRTLEAATKLTTTDTVHASAQILMAKHLLGVIDTEVAAFSFDGEDAGKIKLNQRFEGAAWDYSLDGGQTWSSGENRDKWIDNNEYQLSSDEIESITKENDIKIHLSGVDWSEANIYTIDIVEQVLPSTLYANDWENRVIGVNEKMEWRLSGGDSWTSYRDSSPQRLGDVTIEVRVGRSGTGLASESREFSFTTDTDTDTRRYLPIAHISVAGVSSEATSNKGNAAYAIDGNINTRWHSNYAGADHDKWIIFKFDHNVYLTGMDYLPAGSNGRILEGLIEVSQDGENWTKLGTVDWENNDNMKSADFAATDWARYVRITGVQTAPLNSSLSFITAKLFNFYEDTTKSGHPSAAIGYSTTELTNGDVIARFIKPTDDTVITNNDGSDTYVFKENGSFVFTFETNGVKGQAVASVDWIDKEAPTGRFEFSCAGSNDEGCAREDGKTNHAVEAKLVITNEKDEVTVLNNGAVDVDGGQARDPFVFTFLRNGVFTFRVQDKAGNIGTIEAVVDWIDTAAPKTMIEYDVVGETAGPVVARLVKVMPDAERGLGMGEEVGMSEDFRPIETGAYDENGLEYGEDFVVTNNGGAAEYTFTQNGEFTFEYRDEAGNTARALARVNWIKEVEKPDVPDAPDTPDTPNVPDVPSVPGDGDDGGSNGGENGGNGNASTGGDVSTIVGLPEGVKAESHKLVLGSDLVNRFGAQSEYFEVKFVDADGKKVEVTPESMTMTVRSDKTLKGIYLVNLDGTTENVEYERVSETEVLIKNPKEGRYLFEYEEAKGSNEGGKGDTDVDDKADELPKAGVGFSLWWIVGGLGVVVVILIGRAMILNRRR